MLKIGITGGIGSGKSTVVKLFSLLGIKHFEADATAKALLINSPTLKTNIIELLGENAYLPDGSYNRTWVAQRVFNDKNLLRELNNLVHPEVHRAAAEWFEVHKNETYVLYEAAIMKENNDFDAIVTVVAPTETRIQRILKRDPHRDVEAIQKIIAQQASNEQFIELSDYVIYNDDTDLLIPQVLSVHSQLIQKS